MQYKTVESMQFSVKMCYDDACATAVVCDGRLEQGRQTVTVDNDAQFLMLYFGNEQREWRIKDEQTHQWPATATTCNSFDTSDCGASAPSTVLE